jgi:SAM-dependent methyltransferase
MDAFTRALVEAMVATCEPRGPVVEIGSYQVAGDPWGDLRGLFPGAAYTGCDMRAGPGVDRVEHLESLSFPDASAGTVLCCNVIEHAWEFRRGMAEVERVTAPGGLALVTTAFAFRVHAHPDDYWRFTPRAMERLTAGFGASLVGWQGHEKMPRMVFALGLKRPLAREALDDLAARWRAETLRRWREHLPLRDRAGGAVARWLVGKRHLRPLLHWRELTIRPGEA